MDFYPFKHQYIYYTQCDTFDLLQDFNLNKKGEEQGRDVRDLNFFIGKKTKTKPYD